MKRKQAPFVGREGDGKGRKREQGIRVRRKEGDHNQGRATT
jgi:hypothetical protein